MPFSLDVLTLESRALLERDWSRCLAPAPDPYAKPVTLHREGVENVDDLGDVLAARLTREAVLEQAGSGLFLHACGVSDDAGRVMALVGPSGTGKSVAADRLCRQRFGYVTDETVAVTGDGHVSPYPKPLSFRYDPHKGSKQQVGPDELGLRHCPSDLTLSRLVVLQREPHWRGAPQIDQLTLIEGILALVPHTSSLTLLGEPLQTLCRVIDTCGGVFRLRYAEIAEVEDILADLTTCPLEPKGEWSPVPIDGARSDVTWAIRDGRVRRRPMQDAVRIGEDLLLMVNDRPARLGGIGSTLWAAARDPVSIDELYLAAVTCHGKHPQARRLVAEAVSGLCDGEVLARYAPMTVGDVLAGGS